MSLSSPVSPVSTAAPLNTSSLTSDQANPPITQGFESFLSAEQSKVEIQDYLSYAYVGRKVNVIKNNQVESSGMISKVYYKGDVLMADIWDMKKTVKPLKIKFEKQPGLPRDISDREIRLQEAKMRQKFNIQNTISRSELVESSSRNLTQDSMVRSKQEIKQEMTYQDTETNIEKKAHFIIDRDAIYLQDGHKISVKFED